MHTFTITQNGRALWIGTASDGEHTMDLAALEGIVFDVNAGMTIDRTPDMSRREKIARTIAGLYNHSRPLGMGVLQARPGKLPRTYAYELADAVIEGKPSPDDHGRMFGLQGRVGYFDYLYGRPIKTKIEPDGSVRNTSGYDRDNGGPGAAVRAISIALNDPDYRCEG